MREGKFIIITLLILSLEFIFDGNIFTGDYKLFSEIEKHPW